MTTVYLSQPLFTSRNTPLLNSDNEASTFQNVAMNALVQVTQADTTEPLPKKMFRWELFKKISKATTNSVNLTAEEIILLKDRVNMNYGALVVGQMVDHMERENNVAVESKT